jgi:ferric-dicitrate binding protein FerR (iron transport regulator)
MELLIKFLNNQCTETELNEVLRWLNTDALNEDNKRLIFEDWNSYQDANDLDEDEKFTTIFDKIQEKIDDGKQKENVKASKILTLSVVIRWITKAAAVLLIPVLTFLFYTLNEKKIESDKYAKLTVDSLEVISPIGSRTVVQLSDGSVIHLNYGSKIKYPQFFPGNTRDVELTGEGFFKIAHNPEKPFIVKAGNLNAEAVGTTFNVLAYPDQEVIETTLVNGKVVLYRIGQDGKSKTVTTMTPGQHVGYNIQTNDISSTEGDIQKYILWTEGKLIFEDTPILEVTARLSRMFNVDFEVKDEIKDYIYTVTFIDEPLCQILDLMTIATPIFTKTLPRQKLPDGTFSKPKIIMEKRK